MTNSSLACLSKRPCTNLDAQLILIFDFYNVYAFVCEYRRIKTHIYTYICIHLVSTGHLVETFDLIKVMEALIF